MIKFETIGAISVSKVNPVIKMEQDVVNNSFITYGDELYLVSNTITGDDSYKDDVVIPAGEFVNGYLVKALEGLNLVIDGKHVDGGVSALEAGAILVAGDDGKLKTGEASGVHFVVIDKTTLTEAAVKVKVAVA
jgi:hypothetical protein